MIKSVGLLAPTGGTRLKPRGRLQQGYTGLAALLQGVGGAGFLRARARATVTSVGGILVPTPLGGRGCQSRSAEGRGRPTTRGRRARLPSSLAQPT